LAGLVSPDIRRIVQVSFLCYFMIKSDTAFQIAVSGLSKAIGGSNAGIDSLASIDALSESKYMDRPEIGVFGHYRGCLRDMGLARH
jgi:hypothetical protein